MKNRRTLITTILLAVVLFLGVGYAVISSVTLTINGNISAKTEELDVVISAANPDAAATGVTAYGTVTNPAGLTATLTVTDLEYGAANAKTVAYTITNNDTVSATITQGTITVAKSEFFSVTTDLASPVTVAAGGTTTVNVTVELIKKPIQDTDSTTTATINFTAAPVAS